MKPDVMKPDVMKHDVIVVGGSYAGMAAALQLLRARRRVLVIDAGKRRNRSASHSHGFLGQDGVDPAELARVARAQLAAYPTLTWRDGEVEQALSIWRRDEEIDDHYESLFAELLELMRRDPASVGDGAHLLFIAKNLERIGDHATNIAEVVYFEATGLDLTVERPKWSLPDAVVTDS